MTANLKRSRRNFLKAAGAVTLGKVIFAGIPATGATAETGMPTRAFGKTGIQVPILSFGGSLHLPQLMLRQAFKWGVTYWDTAHSYMGGNSERRIGKYFEKFPGDRRKIFLVTKSHAWDTDGMSHDLTESLRRMQTDYVDLFFVHGVGRIDEMDADKKRWAEKRKSDGTIRFFGFSTHRNMEICMLEAAKLGWIDGIMMSYNFRLMHTDLMKRAVDACAEAGIGLTAMKTQGGGSVRTGTETEMELAGRFLKLGYTDAQAKLKAVWENSHIASICSEMPNMNILMANVSAALNQARLSHQDLRLLRRHAHETSSSYCAGCARFCESAIDVDVPIADVLRYLMYARSYGEFDRAVRRFNRIPEHIRHKMKTLDYSIAEKRCPQKMAIGRFISESMDELSK